jgi:predicted ferric reductase
VAITRSITYRRASGRIADFKKLPSLGLAILVLASCLFAVLICFVQHPYYRQNRGYGSPPLGVRAGLAGTAMTPIVVALSGKYNLVTLLTGISHEKLNFLHRWCGIIYLFFGIVHTIPFLINNYRSGGPKRLYYQFYYHGKQMYCNLHVLIVYN